MSEIKICRICLRTEAKMYKFDRFQLMYYYEEVMALKFNIEDGLPQFFCYECSTLLHKYHKFKEKCYSGQKALKEMLWKGPITYELVYKINRTELNLQSPLEILKVNDRVKTYVTNDDFEEEVIKEESTQSTPEIKFDGILSARSFSDCDDNGEPEIDLIGQESEDEKPLLSDDRIELDVPLESSSPTTIFINEKSEVIKLKDEYVKENKDSVVAITPNAKRYKFVSNKKHARFLDANHWRKINMSEDEAVQKFRSRAEDRKYVAAAFKCTQCFKGFSKLDMLTRHLQLRHNESLGPNECRFCRMRFKWECLLRKHMRQHFTKYECLRCHLVCPLEHTALLHEDSHNGVTTKCIHCGEEFSHRSTYYTHLRTHRSDYVCTLCGVSFVSEAGLHQHKKIKHVIDDIESPDDDEDVNTTCGKCDITFETNKAYVEHLFHSAMHAEGLEDELQDEYSLPRKVLGKKEQIKITKGLVKIKPYDEPIMPFKKRSKKPKRLRRKPMNCHQCGKYFETQAACMRHHIAEHPRTSFFPPTERHICEVCGASLAPGSVAMHQNMHTRSKVYSCDTCGRGFHSSVGLKRHLVTHTGEKPYACSLCDKRFTQSNSMKLHYRTFHLKEPYPKRNRRKKKDEPHTTVEDADDSKTDDESSDESIAEPEMRPMPEHGVQPVPAAMQDRPMPEENVHYLTLS